MTPRTILTQTLLRNLIDIVSKGGNYLLNVGPTAEREFPPAIVERLDAMGRWMAVNGESIYGTTASAFGRLPWGRSTTKIGKTQGGAPAACPTRLYLHVFDWPKGELRVPGLTSKVTRAYLLAQKPVKALEVTASEDGVSVKLPAAAPDKIASVVVLEIVGEPQVVLPAIAQAADGSIRLAAADAEIHGTTAQYETGGGKDNIGYWTDAKDWVSWDVAVTKPGKFEVEVTYACEPGTAGSTFAVAAGDQKVTGKVEATGAWTKFIDRKLGTLSIANPGRITITVKPESKPGFAVMNLKAVTLR